MADFRFTNEHSPAQQGRVIDVLRRPRLWVPTEAGYPDYDPWLEKVEDQLEIGTKRAMLALDGDSPIGAVIYQRHEEDPSVLEIRNISVAPERGGRYVGSFALRNVEIEGATMDFPGVNTVTVDTKVTNNSMIDFLISHGYGITKVTDLYDKGADLDVVLTKSLAKSQAT